MTEIQRANTHNKNMKPWFDKDEWKRVYELLFNNAVPAAEDQANHALQHLYAWRSRADLLPSAIDGTIIILEALHSNEAAFTNLQLRKSHSFSILRFINVCVASRAKQGGLTRAVLGQEIPKWIIEIRNDISHDQKLPSLVSLKAALRNCFQWLRTNYWDAEYEAKKDFISKPFDTSKVEALIQVYFNVLTSDYNHEEIVDILREFDVTTEITKKNVKKVILNEITLSFPIPEDSATTLCNIIINTFLTRYLADKKIAEKISPKMMDEIIIFLYDNNIISIFIKVLLNLNKRYYQDHVLCFYSKILDRIFSSLHNIQNVEQGKSSLIRFTTTNSMNSTTLSDLFELEMVKPIPNVYAFIYLESFSKLLNYDPNYLAFLSPTIRMKNVSGPKLQQNCGTCDVRDIFENREVSEMVVDENDEDIHENIQNGDRIWRRVEDTYIFRKCALGVCPEEFLETPADTLYNFMK